MDRLLTVQQAALDVPRSVRTISRAYVVGQLAPADRTFEALAPLPIYNANDARCLQAFLRQVPAYPSLVVTRTRRSRCATLLRAYAVQTHEAIEAVS